MGKTDFSQLQGLKYPSSLLAIPNREELHFIEGWDLIKDEVKRLTNLAWDADGKGYKIKANNYYQAVNIYYYMIHLNLTINKELQRKKLSSITQEISDKYNLECIRKNLTCLGVKYETPLLKVWDEVFTVEGEFSPCEFPIEEVTQAFNANYDACIEETIEAIAQIPIENNDGGFDIEVPVTIPVTSEVPIYDHNPYWASSSIEYNVGGYNFPIWYGYQSSSLIPVISLTGRCRYIRDFESSDIYNFGDSGQAGIVFKSVDLGNGLYKHYEAYPEDVKYISERYNYIIGKLVQVFFGPPRNIRDVVTQRLSKDLGTGKINTQLILDAYNAQSVNYLNGPSLVSSYAITINGTLYNDWYVPSAMELLALSPLLNAEIETAIQNGILKLKP